jgi:hypothetical protein
VALLLPSTLPFIPSTARAAAIVAALLRALSPGSYLALCHVASDLDPALAGAADEWNISSSLPVTLRSRDEVAALTAGLEPVQPGLVPVNQWRPGRSSARRDQRVPVYAVLARKPGRPPMPRREA